MADETPRVGVFLNPEGNSVDSEGNVIVAIEKIWPGIDVVVGSSKYRTGFSAYPNGMLYVKLPVKVTDENGILSYEDFQYFLQLTIETLKPSIKSFVKLLTTNTTEDDF